VKDIVSGAGFSFADHGVHRLKGLEDAARLFLVTGLDGEPVAPPAEPEEAASRRGEITAGSSSSRRRVIMTAIAAAVVAAAAIALAVRDGNSPDDRANTTKKTFVAELDASDGALLGRIDIVRPGRSAEHTSTIRAIVAGPGAVWVVAPGFEGPTLLHLDPEHREAREPIAIPQPALTVSMVPAFDALWYLAPDRLVRVSASTDEQEVVLRVASTIGVGAGGSLAADRDHLWIGKTDGILMRVDPSGGVARRKVADSVDLIAADDGGLWVVDQVGGVVAGVDPDTLETLWEAPVFGTVGRIAVDDDYLWLLDQGNGVVTRFSSSSGQEAGQVPVGSGATDLASGLGAVWVSHMDGTIARVDRSTREVDPAFASVKGTASAIAVDLGRSSIWVDVGPRTTGSGA
jgi:streptogramin lyase